MRSSSGCGTDDCGRTSATSRPLTTPSPPSTRRSGSRGRRSFAFVRKDLGTASGPAFLVDQRQPRGQGGEGPIGPPRIRASAKQSDAVQSVTCAAATPPDRLGFLLHRAPRALGRAAFGLKSARRGVVPRLALGRLV